MQKRFTKYSILLLLALLFSAPGLGAYLLYSHPDWLNDSKVNKGHLLQPPLALKALENHGKWQVLYWTPTACKQDCFNQLQRLTKVRLALGRKYYQVEEQLVQGDENAVINDTMKALFAKQNIQIAALPLDELAALTEFAPEALIFIADPNKYLIMSYALNVSANDIYADLKLLLNKS